MTATIPTNEPSQLRAGETWKWRREGLTDYPASAWTLKYAFKNATSHFEVTATADGDSFSVSVAASTTDGYTAGKYRWNAWVEGGSSEKYGVDSGWLEVQPKYASTAVLDDRTHARKVLDALEALIEGKATKDQESYTIGSRQITRLSPEELLKWREHYRAEVYAEVLAENARNGKRGNQLVVKL